MPSNNEDLEHSETSAQLEDIIERIESQNSKIEDLEEELQRKSLILQMLEKTIFPALKKRILILEEQLKLKDDELNYIKMHQDLTKLELDSPIPLPI